MNPFISTRGEDELGFHNRGSNLANGLGQSQQATFKKWKQAHFHDMVESSEVLCC